MKNSKIPLLPLFIADAFIFVFVLACAMPSLTRGEAMSGTQTFLCCMAVLIGMCLMLVPYYLEYKKDIAKKHEHTEEARKNFEIIFDELAALRLALADLVERLENDEMKYDSIPAVEKVVVELKRDLKNIADSLAETRTNTDESISNLESARRNTKQSLEEIGADIAVLKESLSAINEFVTEEFDNIKLTINNTRIENQTSDLDDDSEGEGVVSFDDDVDDEIDNKLEEKPRVTGKVEVGHLLHRALLNANDTKSSVEKFLTLSGNLPKETIDKTETKEESQNDDSPIAEEVSETIDTDEIAQQTTNNVAKELTENDDESDFFESADSPVNVDVESAQNNTKPIEESLQSSKEPTQQLSNDNPIEEQKEEPMLFDDLPVSRGKIKPKKGDAVITVNALIGIGNKPYLRGDGAGLSQTKGTPMDYIEIGKWRYVLPEFDAPVNFTVLKNDITPPSGNANFSIKIGEKSELNLIFPLEQELF